MTQIIAGVYKFQTAGVLIVQDGIYVVQERDDKPHISDPGKYSLWGGGVEQGETPEQAAVREVLEETGVIISIDDLVSLTKFKVIGTSATHKDQSGQAYLYAVKIPFETKVKCYEGKDLHRISSLDEIPDGKCSDFLRKAVGKYEQK